MAGHYATEQAYAVYIAYLALGKHFTSDYDFHKYRGKVKAGFEKFSTRNDVFFFYKLSKLPHWMDLLVANFIKNPKVYVRDLLEEPANEVYTAWKKRTDALSYTFSSDLSLLDDDFQTNFVVTNGQMPKLMQFYLNKQISLETITILAHLTNVFPSWEANIVDRTISRDIIRLTKKYYPFLDVDRKKFAEIVKNKFDL